MKIYDVYFKPAMSATVCIAANSKAEAIEKLQNDYLTKDEIIQRIRESMEVDGYELDVVGCEYIEDEEDKYEV